MKTYHTLSPRGQQLPAKIRTLIRVLLAQGYDHELALNIEYLATALKVHRATAYRQLHKAERLGVIEIDKGSSPLGGVRPHPKVMLPSRHNWSIRVNPWCYEPVAKNQTGANSKMRQLNYNSLNSTQEKEGDKGKEEKEKDKCGRIFAAPWPLSTPLPAKQGADIVDPEYTPSAYEEEEFESRFDALLSGSAPGQRKLAEASWAGLGMLPDFPDRGFCRFANTPALPQFTGNMKWDISIILCAYRCIIKKMYGKRVRLDNKVRFRMKPVVLALIQHGVKSPYPWGMQRTQQYRFAHGPDKKPSIDAIFSGPAVAAQVANFEAYAVSYGLSRQIMAPSHREAVTRWYQAKAIALCLAPPNGLQRETAIAALVGPAELARLRRQAEAEVVRIEADLLRRMQANDWIWGDVSV